MKKLFLILATLCMVLGGQFALAQENSASKATTDTATSTGVAKNSGAFTAEDKARAQAQMKQLGELFGVEQPKPKAEEKQEQPKTIADVADKGLDMIGNMVGKIAVQVEKVAPKIWEVMVLQQYAKAISGLIVPWGIVILTLMYIFFIRKIFKPSGDSSDWDPNGGYVWFTMLLPGLIILGTGIWGLVRLSDAILYLVNPDYYAVRDLVKLLLAPATM